MNIRIPLPRMPARLTAMLDRYSDWAEVKTGPTLRLWKWAHTVERMDWVTAGLGLAVCLAYAWWIQSLLWGFALGGSGFVFALAVYEFSIPDGGGT